MQPMHVQLWCHAISLIAESALEGVARARSRCSAIGRNAMSSDLQASYSPLASVEQTRGSPPLQCSSQVSLHVRRSPLAARQANRSSCWRL